MSDASYHISPTVGLRQLARTTTSNIRIALMEYAAIKRDEQLDIYRAMSMMYVLCVTHVVYWLYIGLEPIKSLILVEMPIIFFITGASLSLTKKKSFRKALKNRTKRVLIPY